MIVAGCLALVTSCGGDSSTGPGAVKAPPVARIIFDRIVDSVEVERTSTVVATCVDSTGTRITSCQIAWSIADTTLARVTSAGVVTGVVTGGTNINVSTGGVTASLRVVVLPPAVASVTFPTTSFTMNEGDTLTIPTPAVVDRKGAAVTGRTPRFQSNTAALSVTQTGFVTALVAGAGTITATLDSVSVNLSFNVNAAPIAKVKLVPSILDMGVAHKIATQVSSFGAGGQKLIGRAYTYSVDKPSVATVSSGGIVTGVGPGTATLTVATAGGSVSAPISVAQLGVGGFIIDLQFVGIVSPSVQQAAQQAVQTWEQIISAPLIPYHVVTTAGLCGKGTPAVDKMETSLLVIVQEDSIDGPANTVGLGGPCILRDDQPQLTALGTLTIDKADVSALQQQGLLAATITHEIGHILGIGTFWGDPQLPGFVNLASGLGGVDPVFTGGNARASSAGLGFTSDPSLGVPIENQGTPGDGTRDAHWRASVFGHELMTGTIHTGLNPISLVTIEALADFGYSVVPEAADDFNVLNATSPGAFITPSLNVGTRVRETILFPQFTVTRTGTMRRIPGARPPAQPY